MSWGLVGAGGHARVVVAVMARLGLTPDAVFDTDIGRVGTQFAGIEIVSESALLDRVGASAHLAIGSNAARRRAATAYPSLTWLTFVDPAAQVMDDVGLGEGVFVNMGARLQTGVVLGRHVIVNTGAIVDHDCKIGEFAHLAPGVVLCGGVVIGPDVLVGAGSVVLPGVCVGAGAIIGAGTVVTRDVAPGVQVTGFRVTGALARPNVSDEQEVRP